MLKIKSAILKIAGLSFSLSIQVHRFKLREFDVFHIYLTLRQRSICARSSITVFIAQNRVVKMLRIHPQNPERINGSLMMC